MKKLKTVVVVLVTLAIVGTAFASVETLPGSGWWTSVGMQNVGSSTANVALTAYHVNGGASDTHTGSFTLTVGSSVTFLPGGSAPSVDVSPALETGFQGSMVVSSDQPLVAIGQVGNNSLLGGTLGVTGGYASAQYRGSNEGATTLSYPTVKNNFGSKTTTFYIQAAGAATTVTATVKTNDGNTHTASMAVAANKTWVVSPGDFSPAISSSSCGSANTSPCLGSFKATTSGGEIVGAVVEHQTSTSPATIAQATSLFLPSDADTTVYCPTFKNAFAGGTAPRNTGLSVQNTSGGLATVYLTLVSAKTGLSYYSSASVAGGASYTFNPQAANIGGFPSGGGGTADGLAAATITSTAALIANVNEANQLGTPVKATTYACFGASNATAKIAFPQAKEEFAGSNTGVSIQNTDVTTATVSAVYTCGGVAYTHVNKLLGPGSAYTYYRPHTSAGNWTGSTLPNNKLCAVVATTGGQTIVGIAQEAAYPSGNLDTKNYEGFNLAP